MDYSHHWQANNQSINSPKLAEPQVALPSSQNPDTGSFPKPSDFTPHFPILFLLSFFKYFPLIYAEIHTLNTFLQVSL
jgi:hypothetical protein